MNWSKPVTHGNIPQYGFRSQSATVVKDKIYIFGGLYSQFNKEILDEEDSPLYVFEPDTMFWCKPPTSGDRPKNLRAHTAVLIDATRIVLYGGGNGASYADSLYLFDTETNHWSQITIKGPNPGKRRSHTGAAIKNKLYIFGGGNGAKPLQDTWVLTLTKSNAGETFEWKEVACSGQVPQARGYHSTTVWNGSIYVYGGSDGVNSYGDVHKFDPVTSAWTRLDLHNSIPRSAQSCCQVGPLLFSFGGQGQDKEYCDEWKSVHLGDKTPAWKMYETSGTRPSARGYHACAVYDSRVFVFGGCDKQRTYSDVWICDLGIEGYVAHL